MTKPKMTKNKALGIIANIQEESIFYSDAIEMDKKVKNKGIGLFQHTYPPRKEAFLKEVPDWKTNWKGQIDFALAEEEAQNYLNSNYKDKETATEAFMKEFENPKDQSSEAIQKRINNLNVISFDDKENITVSQESKTDEEIAQQKEEEGYYPVPGEESIEESTLIPEVKITGESKESSEVKYRKEIINRVSGRKEYLEYLEKNQDKFKELANLEKNIPLLSKGTKEYNDAIKRKNNLESELRKKELALKEQLYKNELSNYVNKENDSRAELSRLQNEIKGYLDANEEVPQDLRNQIKSIRNDIQESGNRVKLLTKQGWQNYDISPVQQGYNQNILNPDGSIDLNESKTTPILPDPLSDKSDKDLSYNIVNENTDITSIPITEEVVTPEVITEEAITEEGPPSTRGQRVMGGLGSLVQGAGAALDAIGGPGAIISYIMGKKGLKAAMKEIQPQARPELSPMFMEHFRQTKELAKKGFHPSQEMKFRKELDKTYQIGLENAVRGSGGQELIS